MKGGKYSKTLAKIWVEGIIRILDSRDAIRIRDIEDAMLELIRTAKLPIETSFKYSPQCS